MMKELYTKLNPSLLTSIFYAVTDLSNNPFVKCDKKYFKFVPSKKDLKELLLPNEVLNSFDVQYLD